MIKYIKRNYFYNYEDEEKEGVRGGLKRININLFLFLIYFKKLYKE